MSRKRLLIIGLMMLLALLLSACTPNNYTNAFKAEVETHYTVLGAAWFSSNIPEAEDITMELYRSGPDLTNHVTGTYVLDGETVTYYLDGETGLCYTSSQADRADGYVKDQLEDLLGWDSERTECHSETWLPCLTVAENGEKGGAWITRGTGYYVHAMNLAFSDSQLRDEAEMMLYGGRPCTLTVTLELDSLDQVEEIYGGAEVMMDYPGLETVKIVCSSDEDRYYVMLGVHELSDGEDIKRYTFKKYYRNSSGTWKQKKLFETTSRDLESAQNA